MAVMQIEYYSEALEMEWGVNVLYPDASRVDEPDDPDIPVLYLLHGMSGNHNSWLKRFFPNMSDKREKNFIAGLSMGGYGSFMLALKTNRFSYAASLSGALSFYNQHPDDTDLAKPAYWRGIFGNLKDWTSSPYSLETLAKQSDGKTKFWAWCGEEDFLYAVNNHAVENLRKLGLDISYSHSPGKHEWYYWEKQLEKVLAWLPIDFVLEERLS